MTRKVLGLIVPVKVFGKGVIKTVLGRVDTGATKSSIDAKLASELKAGPILETKLVKSAHGHALRPIIRLAIELEQEKVEAAFTIADRSHMKYLILIGQNVLKQGKFLIDPLKKD